MKKMILKIAVIVTVLGLVGCGALVTDCSDDNVTDLVIQIAKENPGKYSLDNVIDHLLTAKSNGDQSGIKKWQAIADYIQDGKLSVESIRTTTIDVTTGRRECAAQLQFKHPSKTHTTDLTYTVELTDDDFLYVEVSGLPNNAELDELEDMLGLDGIGDMFGLIESVYGL